MYAAGDLAHVAGLPMPLASVLTAAAAGLVAAAACVHDLVARQARCQRLSGSVAGYFLVFSPGADVDNAAMKAS